MRGGISAVLTKTLTFAAHLATAALLVSVAINFVNVIGRYFFHSSLAWAEEVMIYLMLASVFLAAGIISARGAHISMDMLLARMPPRLKFCGELLNDAIQVGVAALLIWLAVPVIYQLFEFDQRSEALHIPIFIPQAAIPLGCALMILGVLARRAARQP